MPKRICIVQGHPDPKKGHFCHALADAYKQGAELAGHEVRVTSIADLDFPILRSKEEWETTSTPPALIKPQQDLLWCDHLFMIYPLWAGGPPALLKAFIEQTLRPSLANDKLGMDKMFSKLLKGKTGRIVTTMGMPGFVFRWILGSHSLKMLKRSILGFCGMGPIKDNLVGLVENLSEAQRQKWLDKMRTLGRMGI